MVRKQIILSAALLTVFAMGQARNVEIHFLDSDLGKFQVPMSEDLKITMGDGLLTLAHQGQNSSSFALHSIDKIKFSSTGGVDKAATHETNMMTFDRKTSTLHAQSWNCNTPELLQVHSATGQRVLILKEYRGEDIDLSALPTGVYICTAGGSNLKFIK